MASLILNCAKFSRSSGQWSDEDYDVLADGKVIGRILEEGSRFGTLELRWGRSTTEVVRVPGVATHGTARDAGRREGQVFETIGAGPKTS
jgi:hypothetical protein